MKEDEEDEVNETRGAGLPFKAEVLKGEGRKYLETFEGSLIVIGGCVSTFQLNVAALFRADCCATCKGVLAESWPSILGFSQYNFY